MKNILLALMMASLPFTAITTDAYGQSASQQAKTSDDRASHGTLALELCNILLKESLVDKAIDQHASEAYTKLLHDDPDIVPIDARFPAMKDDITHAIIRGAHRLAAANTAAMRKDVVKLYAANLSIPELHDLLAFYRSPVGQHILTVSQNDALASFSWDATEEKPDNAKSGTPDLINQLSSADIAAFVALRRQRPLLPQAIDKVEKLTPQANVIADHWSAQSDPAITHENEQEVRVIMQKYVQMYIASLQSTPPDKVPN